jgi:hypothetical protein
MATVSLELTPFEVPTYVTVKMPPGKRQGLLAEPLPTLALNELDVEVLAALIDEFAAAVMAASNKT